LIDNNQLVFILGTPRSGKKIIKCLLDNHPDLIVWPDEFPFFTLYKIHKDIDRKNYIDNINNIIINKMLVRANANNKDVANIPPKTFVGNLDVGLFASQIIGNKSIPMDYMGYLSTLFYAYKKANVKFVSERTSYIKCLNLPL